MSEQDTNNQIKEINEKLDILIQYVEQQRLRTQVVEDLVKDVSIVGNDWFQATVNELDHQNIELNPEEIKLLLIRLVKNLPNINRVVAMLESTNDLLKDIGPILNNVGFDLIEKIAEYDDKGYLDIFKNLINNMDNILRILVQLSQPQFIESVEKMIKVVTTTKLDDDLDNKSLFKIYKEIKKPEVRKSMSYALRIVQEIYKSNSLTNKI